MNGNYLYLCREGNVKENLGKSKESLLLRIVATQGEMQEVIDPPLQDRNTPKPSRKYF